MLWIVLTVVLFILAFVVPKICYELEIKKATIPLMALCLLLAVFSMAKTSFVVVNADSIGHLQRNYLGSSMEPGQVIALGLQQGRSAHTLAPGLQFKPFIEVLFTVEELKEVVVPPDQFLMLTAVDGLPLPPGQIMSPAWSDDPSEIKQMLNAEYFLSGGPNGEPVGFKGMQNVTLPPGNYRFNQYLFEWELGQVTNIEAGFVGVVKSNIQEIPYNKEVADSYAASIVRGTSVTLTTPIVPKGYKGIWGEPLSMGKHWMHSKAYQVTMVDTRVKTLKYMGGFTQRFIDLDFDQDGQITQTPREEPKPIPDDAQSSAITVKVEGWEIPVEVRTQIQIQPQNAPLVVATVGDDEKVEGMVVTPSMRSSLRDVGGAEGRDPLDFMNKRETLKDEVKIKLTEDVQKYGPTIVEVQIGEPGIPPELLVAQRRQQISSDLLKAYREEQAAQVERVEREKQRALGDQQPELVKAEIEQKRAEFKKEQLALEGEGEKLKLTAIAEGQMAQRDVLGEDNVMKLAILDKFLEKSPELSSAMQNLKLPNVLIVGEGSGSMNGASAILSDAISRVSNEMAKSSRTPAITPPQAANTQ